MTALHLAASVHCSQQCGRFAVSVFRTVWRMLPGNWSRAAFGGSVLGAAGAWWSWPSLSDWFRGRRTPRA